MFDPERSQVWIDGSSSVHPIRATAPGLTGWIDLDEPDEHATAGVGAEVRMEVGLLRSGNRLVDRETRRRIDARRFPEIVGTVVSAEWRSPERLELTGVIDFRGESAEVTGEVTLTRHDGGLRIEGSQTLDIRDWGLQPPRLALLRVHPEIEVRIVVEASEEGAQPTA